MAEYEDITKEIEGGDEDAFFEDALPEIPDTEEFSYYYYEEKIPYDVLYEMCRKGRVNIMEVHLSDITEKFIQYTNSLESKNYDTVANFIYFAGTLLEYKSNMLMPRPQEFDEYEEMELDDSTRSMLFAEEYALFQDVTDKLGEMEVLHRFYRTPVFGERDYKIIFKNFDLNKLITMFEIVLEDSQYRNKEMPPQTIHKERFTVAERVIEIINEIRAYHKISFFDLFEKDYGKVEVINTFLAILEILKKQVAKAEQSKLGGDIILTHDPEGDKIDLNDMAEASGDVDAYN